MINKQEKCQTCGKKAHNFANEEALNCIPPKGVLKFGTYEIDNEYRSALYNKFPFYTAEEVVGSYLGHNPYFPSQTIWFEERDENVEDEDFDQ